jgi:hypothetical protein
MPVPLYIFKSNHKKMSGNEAILDFDFTRQGDENI